MTADRLPITVVIITKNEEMSLPGCLASLSDSFAGVVVVDSGSRDATVRIAREAGAQLVPFTWNGEYPKKKQWAVDNSGAETDWVLLLDADERVSKELLEELRVVFATPVGSAAFDIALDYVFMGRRLQHGHRVYKRALMHRSKCRFPVLQDLGSQNMWEVEGHYQPVATGGVGRLKARLLHQDEDPLFDYFSRHNRYSDWEADLVLQGGVNAAAAARSRQGRFFARLPGKPVLFFLYSYVVRLGFLDGYPGFAYAGVQAFYYWQIGLKVRQGGELSLGRPVDSAHPHR